MCVFTSKERMLIRNDESEKLSIGNINKSTLNMKYSPLKSHASDIVCPLFYAYFGSASCYNE